MNEKLDQRPGYINQADSIALTQAKQLLRDYHLALDLREHAGSAAHRMILELQKLFEMPYIQGDEQKRRRAGQ